MNLIKSQITLVQVLTLCGMGQVSICTKLHNQHHGVNEFQMPVCFSADHPCVKWKLGKQTASVLNLNSFRNHWQPNLSGMESPSPQTQSLSLFPGFHCTVNRIALPLVGKIRVTSLMILIHVSSEAFQRALLRSLGICFCFEWGNVVDGIQQLHWC